MSKRRDSAGAVEVLVEYWWERLVVKGGGGCGGK